MRKPIWLIVFLAVVFIDVRAEAKLNWREMMIPVVPEYTVHTITRTEMVKAKRAKKNIYRYLFGKQARNVARFNRRASHTVRPGDEIKVPKLRKGVVYTPLPRIWRLIIIRHRPGGIRKREFNPVSRGGRFRQCRSFYIPDRTGIHQQM